MQIGRNFNYTKATDGAGAGKTQQPKQTNWVVIKRDSNKAAKEASTKKYDPYDPATIERMEHIRTEEKAVREALSKDIQAPPIKFE